VDYYWAYSLALKMEAMFFLLETSVVFQRTTRRFIPEDGILHNYRCENLRSYKEQQDGNREM
jgi:hypothetical protein